MGVLFSCQTKKNIPSECIKLSSLSKSKRWNETDIPVSDYEIAVFDNRFSALSFNPPNIKFETNTEISSAYGSCEVISYSQDHNTKFQSLTIEHVPFD